MAGQDFYTMTPGSAVADSLEEILTKRKADQRQAMLDEINRRNTESEMQYRSAMADSLTDSRAAQAESRNASAAERRGKEEDRKRTLLALDAYQIPTDVAPNIKHAIEIAKSLRDPDLFKNIIQQMGQADARDAKENEWVPVYNTDRHGNTVETGEWMPKNAVRTTTPAPQQPTAASQPSYYERPDPEDPTKKEAWWLPPGVNPGEPGSKKIEGGPLHKGNTPPPPNPTAFKPEVSPTEASKYAVLRGKATPVPGGMFGGGKKPTAQDQAAFAQLEQHIFSLFPSHIAQVAKSIRDHEDPGTPNQVAIDAAIQQGLIKPEEKEALYRLLQVVR